MRLMFSGLSASATLLLSVALASNAAAFNETFVNAIRAATFNPTDEHRAFDEGLNQGRTLAQMARDNVFKSPYDCPPEFRVECFDALEFVAGGKDETPEEIEANTIHEWGEWVDIDLDTAITVTGFWGIEALERGFNLLTNEELQAGISHASTNTQNRALD